MKRKNIFILIYCLIIATITLFLSSKCSPIYPYNGWDDFNTFYTVGSSWYKGLIPYRDLFEQKGPFLYLIFLIGYLITPGKFIGIFILEIIFFTITLYISNKIIKLFIKNKSNLIILPLYATVLTTSVSFIEGGSSEEFNLLFTTITFYYILLYLKTSKLSNISYQRLIISALGCGLSLMIKYTTIGLWFIMMIVILTELISLKKYKEAVKKSVIFIIAMCIPFLLFCVYFYLNDGLYDFINTYFYINIFKYSTDTNLFIKVWHSIKYFLSSLFTNIPTLIITFSIVYYQLLNFFILKQKVIKFNAGLKKIAIISIFTIIILFYSQEYRPYALIAIYFYVLLMIIYLFVVLKNKKWFNVLASIATFITLIVNIDYEYMNTKKEDTVQYHFASIINKDKDATLLQYMSLDEGFYTVSNITPNSKYFEMNNISYEDYPEIYEEQDEVIKNKRVTYVIYRMFDLNNTKGYSKNDIKNKIKFNNRSITRYLFDNYELVDEYYPRNGYYDSCIYYLYKVKD